MQNKKIPERQCIGCRESKGKKELIRIVKTPEGDIALDFTGRKNGRGAYLCDNYECLKKARERKVLSRSFRMEIPDGIYDELEREWHDRE